jgi:uncharacterized protein YndB with AHSA1/START domain
MTNREGWMRLWSVAVAIALAAAPGRVWADVVDASAAGFTVRTSVQVAAPASRVYDTLVKVASWWDPEHTYSGDARNLSIDARAAGCFCERLPDGGSIAHMTVLYAAPGRILRLGGGLGPLQDMAATGVMTWMLTEADGATKMEMTYAAGGYAPKGLDSLAAAVDQVLAAQVQRLKLTLEQPAPGK